MSLKLGFASNSSPFFLAAGLCLERFSVLQPFSFKTSFTITLHIPKYCVMSVPAIPSPFYGMCLLQTLGSPSFTKSNITLILPLVSTLPLPEITENTLGSFWIEHTLKGNICNTSLSFQVMLSHIYARAALIQLQ